MPRATGSAAYYRDKPMAHHEVLERSSTRFFRVRKAIESALDEPAAYRILDVGCASGAHLAVYGANTEKYGVEPAESARDALHAREIAWLGSYVHDVGAETFDAVTCLDVIEHVEQPRALLDGIDRCLRPGGAVAIVTGNIDSYVARFSKARWLYYALPEHCSFFSRQALDRYWVTERGYSSVAATWIANADINFSYVAAFLRAVAREVALKSLPRGRVDAIETAGRGHFPFFCDNMLLTFRKPTA